MLKVFAGAFLGLLLLTGGASAQSCSGATYTTLTNGNVADATQVMGNFGCVLTSPAFAGPVGIGMTPVNVLDITQNQNNSSTIKILNSNAGTAALAAVETSNGTNSGALGQLGQNYTTTGVFVGGYTYINSSSGLSLFSGGPILFAVNNSTTEVGAFGTDGSFLVGGTTNVGAGRIYSSAGLLVNQTTSATGSYIDVKGSTSGVGYTQTGTSAVSGYVANLNTTSALFGNFFYQSVNVGSISTNGSSTAYNTTSDRRLKANIKPLRADVSLKALKAYDPSDYLLGGKYAVGAVAQWVDARMKAIGIDAAEIGLVHRGDSDILRKPTDKDFRHWQMDSSKMMPFAIRTILDHEARIDALEKENARLSRQLMTVAAQNQRLTSVEQSLSNFRAANDNRAADIQALKAQIGALDRRLRMQTAQR